MNGAALSAGIQLYFIRIETKACVGVGDASAALKKNPEKLKWVNF